MSEKRKQRCSVCKNELSKDPKKVLKVPVKKVLYKKLCEDCGREIKGL